MPTKQDYDATLDRLCRVLRQKPLTAKAIADRFSCSKPVAYQRIAALRARGVAVYTIPVRESATGPRATAYGVRV